MELKWNNLLCEERIRESISKNVKGVVRNEFEADYDRIVGSSSVRRLQDKAQVFPLQKNDFVRTRLTHSMEVSAIARSIAKRIGIELEHRGIFDRDDTEKLMGLLQTAGLVHDLGNPPFGHYGETAIRNWYRENVLDTEDKEHVITLEEADFLYFDGNVQNLRILTKLQTMNDQFGINFTYGTLATIIKYPYSSFSKHDKNKFGYFQSEAKLVEKIWEKTGLREGVRHPATYILEAADDICYLCDDIEDGIKKGYIQWDKEYRKLIEKYRNTDRYKDLFIRLMDENKQPDKDMDEEEKLLARIKLFRNYTQGMLINNAVETFFEKYSIIMHGEFGLSDLLINDKEFVSDLKEITAVHCFSCDEVLSLELVGERVINELLNILFKAVSSDNVSKLKKTNSYEGKVFNLISSNYKYVALFDYDKNTKRSLEDLTQYDKIHLIVDFVSGMTDSYAMDLYKQLMGISLPQW